MSRPLVGIPIKPFGVAKARLAPVIDAPGRARLGMAIAAHTAKAVAAAGAAPLVVTGDGEVAAWARSHGWGVIDEPPGGGLDGAAGAVVAAAAGRPWVVVHADLPIVTSRDLAEVWRALEDGAVIAPTMDGGTSVLGGHGPMRFAYGKLSFHRHLAAAPDATVVVRLGLALDLDRPAHLAAALGAPAGGWLRPLVPVS